MTIVRPLLWILLLAVLFFHSAGELLLANPGYGGREGKSCIHCHVRPSGGGGLNGNGSTYLKEGHKFPTDDEDDGAKDGGGEDGAKDSGGEDGAKDSGGEDGAKDGGGEDGAKDGGGEDGAKDVDGAKNDTKEEPFVYISETEKQKKARLARLAEIEAKNVALERKRAHLRYKRVLALGKKLFSKAPRKLSSNGKSCVHCHDEGKLSRVRKEYPRWHKGLGRVVTFDRMIRLCIYHRMKGDPLSPESKYSISLTAYLKELESGD